MPWVSWTIGISNARGSKQVCGCRRWGTEWDGWPEECTEGPKEATTSFFEVVAVR